MLWLFLRERKAWILFLIVLFAWMNLSFVLDAGFSGVSILYYNGISMLLFAVFLVWRYYVETKQICKLDDFLGNKEGLLSNSALESHGLTGFEKKYVEGFIGVLRQKEQELSEIKLHSLEESDDLLAWVHEVKSPLTAMKLMLDQVGNRKTRERLDREWIRIYLLVDQQLHSTRLPSIEKDNCMEEIDIHKVVVREIHDLQTWCLEKGIGFDMEQLDAKVVTDQKWLAFIVRQLLTNAVKYSEPNSEVQLFTEVHKTGHILFHIKDAGIGIRLEDITRIFQKTYTGTVGRESVASTGMGLYLAKKAADKLGIQILVESIVGKSSTFTLKFPLENEYIKTIGR